MFNPHPKIEEIPIDAAHACLVIDDALLEPEKLVALARLRRDRFAMAPHNAYPGLELRMPDAFSAQLDDFFRLHIRARLGARRTLRMYSRLSMVTLPPAQLQPRQSICHRDRLDPAANRCIAASVLYLFHDSELGGTSFYAPRQAGEPLDRLLIDSGSLAAGEFTRLHGIAPGYMTEGNRYFEKLLTVPARWNRLIFYDGSLFHSGHITHPGKLDVDPETGRLTVNGFFTCSKSAS